MNDNGAKPYVKMVEAVRNDDFETAQTQFDLITRSGLATYNIFAVWLGCKANNVTLIEEAIGYLDNVPKRIGGNYYEILWRKNYSPELTRSLLDIDVDGACAPYAEALGLR